MKYSDLLNRARANRSRIVTIVAIAGIAFSTAFASADVANAAGRRPHRRGAKQALAKQLPNANRVKIKVGWGGCAGCAE
jgi:hypothetical protein